MKTDRVTQSEKIKELTERLENGIREFWKGDKFKTYLNTLAHFRSYSLNNQLLIAIQKPDATLCAGYSTWKLEGRYVKQGEKGIQILCPAPYRKKIPQDKTDPATGEIIYGKDGKPEKEWVEHIFPAFKIGYTYDISQTDGRELPSIANRLTENVSNYDQILQAVVTVSPVPVSFEEIPGETNGFYHLAEKRIAVQKGMSESMTLKTTIHEISHAVLHDPDVNPHDVNDRKKGIQAEAIAYAICSYLGIDSSDYSFGYITGYSGQDVEELRESMETIRETSCYLIDQIDRQLTAQIELSPKANDVTDSIVNNSKSIVSFKHDITPQDKPKNRGHKR